MTDKNPFDDMPADKYDDDDKNDDSQNPPPEKKPKPVENDADEAA